MRIKETTEVGALRPETPVESRGPPQKTETTAPPAAQVAISIANARAAADAARSARLQEIRAAVERGTYKPDPGRIADQILEAAEINARLRTLLIP
ncbi:MAG: flagellar biosynthesis anti-sigma factor FlgM [Myxococcota bacterium]